MADNTRRNFIIGIIALIIIGILFSRMTQPQPATIQPVPSDILNFCKTKVECSQVLINEFRLTQEQATQALTYINCENNVCHSSAEIFGELRKIQ